MLRRVTLTPKSAYRHTTSSGVKRGNKGVFLFVGPFWCSQRPAKTKRTCTSYELAKKYHSDQLLLQAD